MIQGWYCKEILDTNHSKQSKGWRKKKDSARHAGNSKTPELHQMFSLILFLCRINSVTANILDDVQSLPPGLTQPMISAMTFVEQQRQWINSLLFVYFTFNFWCNLLATNFIIMYCVYRQIGCSIFGKMGPNLGVWLNQQYKLFDTSLIYTIAQEFYT